MSVEGSVGRRFVRGLPASLLELSLELLAVFEEDGRFVQVNARRWSELLGWSEEELIGRHFAEFVHPDDLPSTAQQAREAFAEGKPTCEFANRYRTRAGGYRWLLWESRELGGGRWLAAARDITRERETLRELDALRRVATQVAGASEPAAIFARVAEEIGCLMDADAVGISKQLDEQRLQIAGVWVRDRAPAFAPGQVLEGASLLGRFRAGGVVRHPERAGDRDTLEGLRRYGSSVTVPVCVQGAEWGRITAFYLSRGGARADAEPRRAEVAALT